MVEDGAEELEDLVHFSVSSCPSRGYGVAWRRSGVRASCAT